MGVELEQLSASRVAVDGVADDGAAERGAMDAQLVGSAGTRPQFEPDAAARHNANPVIGNRSLTGRIDYHAPAGAAGQLFEASFDPPLGFRWPALDDGPID